MEVRRVVSQEYVFIQGKLSWVYCYKPNQWGDWTVTIHPTPPSLEKIRELQTEGIKNVLKKDEDGYYTRFKRPTQRVVKGKVIGLTAPEVLQADGKTPLKLNVGNGSDGVVKLEVYQHNTPSGKKAKAARLLSVKVDNLVPFEMKRDFSEGQKEAVEGLAEQPVEHLF